MTLPFVRELFSGLARQSPLARVAELCLAPPAPGPRPPIELAGLTSSAQMLAAAQLQRLTGRPLIVLVADNRAAEELSPTLTTFADLSGSAERPLVLPGFEIDPYEGLSPHPAILEQRALALWRASQGMELLLVPAVAAATRLAEPRHYGRLALRLRRGDVVELDGLAEHLTSVGYQRQDPVEMPGQFSIRGGLLDAFSPEAARPIRLELFGDEIESLREFDPGTQRSVAGDITEAVLLPLTPTPLDLASGEAGPGWEFRVPGARGFDCSILEFGDNPVVVMAEPEAFWAELERWWERLRERHGEVGEGPAPETIFFTPDELRERLGQRTLVALRELALGGGADAPPALEWLTRPAPRYHGAIARMVDQFRAQLAAGERLVFLGANAGEVERLGDLFTEYRLPFQFGWRQERTSGDYLSEKVYAGAGVAAATLAAGSLLRGFSLPEAGLTVYGPNDLFQQDAGAAAAAPQSRSRASSFLNDFRDLTPGDYVVHIEHGIGRYTGLTSFDSSGAESLGAGPNPRLAASPAPPRVPHGHGAAAPVRSGEFMALEYADKAKLYVPLTRMDLVQKYRSAEGAQPVLDRLGGTQWAQRKSRVKKAMKDMADELLKLYAARQAVAVAACPPDDHLHREFEDAFPYIETDDQARAIGEVRQDLEATRPMDRLLVGDVGYGKTEVAMRAAFKVVSTGRQVAVLAPTTVLAFQHEQTFRERMRAFPISVGLLSRFRSRAEQKEVVEQLALGKLDIVIGTHRLLSHDVAFRDLGLLVVDEEQRFGVRHKERMKQLKKEVHVLAMSATPIPRTLNMALAGLRDMSVIETPPRDRLAIQTVVAAWNENLIAAALRQELERGGQVYFVHNRVDSIWEVAALLQRLQPEARIAVGHGQMAEDELEKVMLRFVRHEADILVSTTIIENGLDIPLANTIIINRADRLGLSELYQLRGRVGRSNRRAYAYLLVPPEIELPPLARKRLAAMREFSDLGAGFKLAALDLELRGAGNMLGGEQSGYMDAVGFDLYVQMLEQTVRELKGEAVAPSTDVQLHLGVDIRIPAEYVPEENQRLRMYKRLAEASTESEREDVMRELRDRYGPPPETVQNLLAYAALRPRCQALGLTMLERRRDQLWLRFSPLVAAAPAAAPALDARRLASLVAATAGAQFSPEGVLKVPFTASGTAAVLAQIEALLRRLSPPAA
ncbi:MAG: transcription-repair coupling factor [Terriglobales bacterium]